MNLTIKAKNTTLTPAIKSFINEKIAILERFLKEEDKVRVELEVDKREKDGLHFRVEIDIQPRGYFADAKATDFYVAMDMVIPKIKEQLVKTKDKKMTERRKAARSLKKNL
jgi:putative sigma-54 modulation protein